MKCSTLNIVHLESPSTHTHTHSNVLVRKSLLPGSFVATLILFRLYLRCKKVQGSISGRKIKRNTSSAVWNTERKYKSTPHSYPTSSILRSTVDIGIADKTFFSFSLILSAHVNRASRRFVCWTLSEVGEVRGIKCNYGKQFGKLSQRWQAQTSTRRPLQSPAGARRLAALRKLDSRVWQVCAWHDSHTELN